MSQELSQTKAVRYSFYQDFVQPPSRDSTDGKTQFVLLSENNPICRAWSLRGILYGRFGSKAILLPLLAVADYERSP